MAKQSKVETCHICGALGKLSFEHVPPRSAFNDHRMLALSFDDFIGAENLDNVRGGRVLQRGVGAYTLCGQCNNDTGSWYGAAYAEWAAQAMKILIGTRGKASLEYPFNLFPLRVLKQVACLFFSVNSPDFRLAHPDLVRFVLDKDSRAFPRNVKIYGFYTFSNRMRRAGVTGLAKGIGSTKISLHLFSEITFPPFGFVMTFADQEPPESGFCEISGLADFNYIDWRSCITMRLPVMPIYTWFPGDYRTREQTTADYQRNKALEAALR
jgi:hypothetical protein